MVVEQAAFDLKDSRPVVKTRDQADPAFLAEIFAINPQFFREDQRADVIELEEIEARLPLEKKTLMDLKNNLFVEGELIGVGGTFQPFSKDKNANLITIQEDMLSGLEIRITFLKRVIKNRQEILDAAE